MNAGARDLADAVAAAVAGGVSITDALTGGDVTEQKPHCDWEGFDDGKYKNAWNGCDWGSCDEWE